MIGKSWMAFGLALGMISAWTRADEERLTAVAQVRPGPIRVGEAVEVLVGVVAEKERPAIEVPKVAGADLSLIKTELRPISTSGIGDEVFVKNIFRFRYRLIPRKAGPLTIPPFHARLDDRSGASAPIKLTIKPLPEAGRTAEFLGGVGAFEVGASVEPGSIRLGQTVEYRVTVSGPAARGVNDSPRLGRLERVVPASGIERRPDVAIADPPEHVFVYRLRPDRPGTVTLPPVSVAAFDPKAERYVTKVAASVTVLVTDVPRFDPSRIDYGLPARSSLRFATTRRRIAAAAVLLIGAVGLRMVWARAGRRPPSLRLIQRALAEVSRSGSVEETARATVDGLTRWLGCAVGRAEGALTPAEAADGVARATGLPETAEGARRLVERCDKVLYDRSFEGEDIEGLREEARELFQRLLDSGTVRPS